MIAAGICLVFFSLFIATVIDWKEKKYDIQNKCSCIGICHYRISHWYGFNWVWSGL